MTDQMTPEQIEELKEKIKKMSPQELKEFQKQQCVFCHIIAGKINAKKVYEDTWKKLYSEMDDFKSNVDNMHTLAEDERKRQAEEMRNNLISSIQQSSYTTDKLLNTINTPQISGP